MRHRLLVGPAQWWDRAVIVGWWISVDLALRAGVRLPVLARFAHVSLDSGQDSGQDSGYAQQVDDSGAVRETDRPPLASTLSATERRRLRIVAVVADRWPFGEGPCLRQALVAGRALRRLRPRLSLGVARRSSGELIAHAWLELEGGARLGYSDDYRPLTPWENENG